MMRVVPHHSILVEGDVFVYVHDGLVAGFLLDDPEHVPLEVLGGYPHDVASLAARV